MEVVGELQIEAYLPGKQPSVQVKLVCEKPCTDLALHHLANNKTSKAGELDLHVVSLTPPSCKVIALKYIAQNGQMNVPFTLKASLQQDRPGQLKFELKLERQRSAKIEAIFVKLHFPQDVVGASLTSLPEGLFTYNPQDQNSGEWVFQRFEADQLNYKLNGILKLARGAIVDPATHRLNQDVVATVNLKILDFSFTGNKIEKIGCLADNVRDDASVIKTIERISFAKNIEFRL